MLQGLIEEYDERESSSVPTGPSQNELRLKKENEEHLKTVGPFGRFFILLAYFFMVVNPVHLGNCSYDVSLSALRFLIVVNSSI